MDSVDNENAHASITGLAVSLRWPGFRKEMVVIVGDELNRLGFWGVILVYNDEGTLKNNFGGLRTN